MLKHSMLSESDDTDGGAWIHIMSVTETPTGEQSYICVLGGAR